MTRSTWLWRIGVAFYGAGLLVFASPTLAAVAAVSIGDVTFGWGHVLVLMGIGAAWQDVKTTQARDREERKSDREAQKRDRQEMREEIHELRQEMRERFDKHHHD